MGIPVPSTGSVTEDVGVVGGTLTVSGDIDYLLGDDSGDWTVVTADTSLGFGSSFSMDADGNWTFTVDNSDPGIQGLDAGETEVFQYNVTSTNGASTVTITVFGADEPPCFVRGTLIDTPGGARPIETLRAGDTILTADSGPVNIRWIGSRHVHISDTGDATALAPIIIQPDAFGPGVPNRVLRVSPLHRVLCTGHETQLMFGTDEVLCPARSLINGTTIQRSDTAEVEYFHILLDDHGIVLANGCQSETLYPGREGLSRFDVAAREEIFTLLPELRAAPDGYGPAARRILKCFEADMLAPRHAA